MSILVVVDLPFAASRASGARSRGGREQPSRSRATTFRLGDSEQQYVPQGQRVCHIGVLWPSPMSRVRSFTSQSASQPASESASQPVSRKHGKPDIWPAHGQCVRQRSGVGPPRRESGAVRSRKPTAPAAARPRRNRKRARRGRPYMDASHSIVHCQPAFASVVGHSCVREHGSRSLFCRRGRSKRTFPLVP